MNFPAGESCYFWFGNDIFENSEFGFLDLDDGWDVPADAQCPNVGAADRRDWILGNQELETDPLNYPAATYVCRDSGLAASNWSDPARRLDQELIFPITRCDATVPGGQGGHVDRNGTEVPCTTAPDKYDVTIAGIRSLTYQRASKGCQSDQRFLTQAAWKTLVQQCQIKEEQRRKR